MVTLERTHIIQNEELKVTQPLSKEVTLAANFDIKKSVLLSQQTNKQKRGSVCHATHHLFLIYYI